MNRLFAALVFATSFVTSVVPITAEAADKPTLVTILASPDAETQLMAMTLTLQSLKQGATSRVLLCGPGGDIALKDAPSEALTPQKPSGKSPQDLLKAIIAAGAPVEVCAIYLPSRNLGADVLLDGVGQAKPDAIASHLIAENTRIMSF